VLIDAERIGRAAGSTLSANCVLLGALCQQLDLPSEEVAGLLRDLFERKGQRVMDVNNKAFRLGRRAAEIYVDALARGGKPLDVRRWLAELPPEQMLTDGRCPFANEPSLGGFEGIQQLLHNVAAEGRTQLREHEVYAIVEIAGAISPPKHFFVPAGGEATKDMLDGIPGQRVVLKVVSSQIVHKSDSGGVVFAPRSLDEVNRSIRQLVKQQGAIGPVDGVLVVEFVEHDDAGFGKELFVGIRASREFGPVIAAGVGGVDTEYLAERMKPGQAVAKALALDVTASEFLDLFRATAAYNVLSGQARGHRRLISDGELLRCFRGFIELARRFFVQEDGEPEQLVELEVNPFALARQRMIPLDGRARLGNPSSAARPRPMGKIDKLIQPKSIAIVGVSSKRVNFARQILRNILDCGFDSKHLCAIHPEMQTIDGVPCYPSISEGPLNIDLLVVAAASESVPSILEEAISCGRVASVVLIPGGLGETESSAALQERIRTLLHDSRERPDRGPVVLGGNCMGVRSRPGNYDTFFVPPEKLDPRRDQPPSPVALITQSGAFAITRLSNLESVNPLITATIGNQIDLTVADITRTIGARKDIHVLGIYVEGFNDLDGVEFVEAVRAATRSGKVVIFYKAGRTAPGRSATAGHTASLAGDYDVCQAAAAQAGAIVVDTFKEFEQLVELATLFHEKKVNGRRIGAISNAGFETVGMADTIQGPRYHVEIADLTNASKDRINESVAAAGLEKLVTVRNPLDLNPMAGEAVYEEAILTMLDDPNVDAVVASIVPFTPELRTMPQDLENGRSLAHRIPEIFRAASKPLAVVVDAGAPYDVFARRLRSAGVPVFPSCDQAIRSLGRYLHHCCRHAPIANITTMERQAPALACGAELVETT
jgi:acyl-CoA synthetase (NDP forming)